MGVWNKSLRFKGWCKKGITSIGITYIDNKIDQILNKEINGDYEGSLYFQKYTSQVQAYKEIDWALTYASYIPIPEVSVLCTAFGFIHNFQERDGKIIANNSTGFVKGAQAEITRIDNLISNSSDKEFTAFLANQKDKLYGEMINNKKYFLDNISFGYWGDIKPRELDIDKNKFIENAKPLPGIDYNDPIYRGQKYER